MQDAPGREHETLGESSERDSRKDWQDGPNVGRRRGGQLGLPSSLHPYSGRRRADGKYDACLSQIGQPLPTSRSRYFGADKILELSGADRFLICMKMFPTSVR